MFSRYFSVSYFPDGWGAVGDLPEGSISGGTTFHIAATASWTAMASIEGSAALTVTTTGTASASDAGGSSIFSISATATLTYTEQPSAIGRGGFWVQPTRRPEITPGWMEGWARFRVDALGYLTSTMIEPPAVVEPIQPEIPIVVSGEPLTRDDPAPVAYAKVHVAVSPVMAKAPSLPSPAMMDGAALFRVHAVGALSFEQIQTELPPPPPAPPPHDDTEEIVLALLMLRRAA